MAKSGMRMIVRGDLLEGGGRLERQPAREAAGM
jgi:hypothetical protein